MCVSVGSSPVLCPLLENILKVDWICNNFHLVEYHVSRLEDTIHSHLSHWKHPCSEYVFCGPH